MAPLVFIISVMLSNLLFVVQGYFSSLHVQGILNIIKWSQAQTKLKFKRNIFRAHPLTYSSVLSKTSETMIWEPLNFLWIWLMSVACSSANSFTIQGFVTNVEISFVPTCMITALGWTSSSFLLETTAKWIKEISCIAFQNGDLRILIDKVLDNVVQKSQPRNM